eukprot:scaffold95347_cov22-Phaeocystis_antarctica.AAC.1
MIDRMHALEHWHECLCEGLEGLSQRPGEQLEEGARLLDETRAQVGGRAAQPLDERPELRRERVELRSAAQHQTLQLAHRRQPARPLVAMAVGVEVFGQRGHLAREVTLRVDGDRLHVARLLRRTYRRHAASQTTRAVAPLARRRASGCRARSR